MGSLGKAAAALFNPTSLLSKRKTGMPIPVGGLAGEALAGAADKYEEGKRAKEREATDLQNSIDNSQRELEADIQKEDEAYQKKMKNEADEANRNSARAKQKVKAKGRFGRRDTILTGPLGLIGEPAKAGKKLFGL